MREAKQEMLPWPLLRGHLLEELVCRLPLAQNSLHLLPSILLLPLLALPKPLPTCLGLDLPSWNLHAVGSIPNDTSCPKNTTYFQ